MLVGYARASTQHRILNVQRNALKEVGCRRIFTDVVSGASAPGLAKALEYARPGDTLVVWRLDRFARSQHALIEGVIALHELNIGFRSLCESLDTTILGGHLVVEAFAALIDFERGLSRARSRVELQSARAGERRLRSITESSPTGRHSRA
jgi:DNA invertase Pin-like site-specific DNA recombinase